MVAWGQKGKEGEVVEGSRETRGGNRYVCYLDCGDGFSVTYTFQSRSNGIPPMRAVQYTLIVAPQR